METEKLMFFDRKQSLFRGLYLSNLLLLLIYFFQKFSASQRQLGTAEGGMAHSADVMSDDAKVWIF